MMRFRSILGGLLLALSFHAHASLVVLPRQLVVDAEGDPRSGAKLFIYASGTTTPLVTYTTPALSAAHASPVVAVSTGLFPSIYLPSSVTSYKIVLKDSADVTIYTEDNIPADGGVSLFGPIDAESGVTVDDTSYQPLDIRRYGAVCDYDSGAETDGQVATVATDNLDAIDDAILVATNLGGGVIRIQGGGDCYVSNSIDASGVSNLYFYVEPGTTLRSTKYTNLGTLIMLGHDGPVGTSVSNVGVFGGGTLRTHRPVHSTVAVHAALTAYDVGDYVKATDTNGNVRAYYCKTAGTSGAASPPDVVNGSDTDGTVVWQDADNDNVISAHADGVRIEGMNIPSASGKPITVQIPTWKNVWIINNKIGTTNDKGIEVKGNTGTAGQEAAFGTGAQVVGNTIEVAGYEGIEMEQATFSSALNQNCRVVGNLVRSAGTIDTDAAGIRVNRCENVEVRGNKVLDSGGYGFHLRLLKALSGDIHSESAGIGGVHLQSNSGFALDYVYVKGATTAGVQESSDIGGGFIGRLFVDTADDGYSESSRAGDAPVIASYKFSTLSGDSFVGALPSIIPQVPAAKIQSFTLQITNTAGTLQHRFCDDTVNCALPALSDRITAASATLANTPTATDASTAFAAGGKVSSANTNEFILNHANAAASATGINLCSIAQNDTDIDAIVAVTRRSVDVNGATLSRVHLLFRQTVDGAALALNTTNIASAETISAQCVIYLP